MTDKERALLLTVADWILRQENGAAWASKQSPPSLRKLRALIEAVEKGEGDPRPTGERARELANTHAGMAERWRELGLPQEALFHDRERDMWLGRAAMRNEDEGEVG